jgi:hypothetical protein
MVFGIQLKVRQEILLLLAAQPQETKEYTKRVL